MAVQIYALFQEKNLDPHQGHDRHPLSCFECFVNKIAKVLSLVGFFYLVISFRACSPIFP